MASDIGSSSRDVYDGDWDESDSEEEEQFFAGDSSLANSNKSKKPYTNPVLLGFADEIASDVDYQKAYDELANDTPTVWDSRLGGKPIWLHIDSKPERKMITCDCCSKIMTLLAQLSMPKKNTFYERVLYVFICREPGCRYKEGSIKCIKGIRRDAAKEKEAEERQLEDEMSKQAELAERLREEKEKKEEEKKKQEKLAQTLFSSSNDDSSSENPFNTGPFGASTTTESKTESQNPFGASNPFGAPAPKKEEPVKKAQAPSKKNVVESYASKASKSLDKPSFTSSPTPVNQSSVYSSKDDYSTDDIPAFSKSYFVDTEYETIDPKAMERSKQSKGLPSSMTPEHIKKLMASNDVDDDDFEVKTKGKGKNSRTTTERLDDASAFEEVMGKEDPTFQHFVDIVGQNSDQIIRYYRLLEEPSVTFVEDAIVKPLLYSSKDTVGKQIMSGIPKARNPKTAHLTNYMELDNLPIGLDGKPQSIEFQIMPYAISLLEKDLGLQEMLEKGMEWGTIFVASSENDCTPKLDENGVSYTQEWVGVQWETQK